MRCEQVKALLDAYADGELTAKDAHKIVTHLQTCPDCRREWERVQRLREWLDDAFASFRPKSSPSLRQRLECALVKVRPKVHRRSISRQAAKLALFALPALVLFALLSLRFSLSHRLPERANVVTPSIALEAPMPKPPSVDKLPSVQTTTESQRPDIVLPSVSQTPTVPRRSQANAQVRSASRRSSLTASTMPTHPTPLRPVSLTPKRAVNEPFPSPATAALEQISQSPFPSLPTALSPLPDEPVVVRIMRSVSPASDSSAWASQVLSAPMGVPMASVVPQGVVMEPVAVMIWHPTVSPSGHPE